LVMAEYSGKTHGFHLTVQERLRQPAVSSRAKSRDLANAEHVTQLAEVLRLRPG
jgi:hypothetical protein